MDKDLNTSSRKQDHIDLASQSRVELNSLDNRFYYEPILSGHPLSSNDNSFSFLDKNFQVPFWVSSMTGGTEYARTINYNLARVAHDYGFGMGLGSCRSLLTSDQYLEDFDVRDIIGDDLPLYANLGIAQTEQLLQSNKQHYITELLKKLRADGLIIHVNPLQEWLQPEGDKISQPPLNTIISLIDNFPDLKIIVKEVGQGMGYESLKALFQLPLAAIDFAANGGTNFSNLANVGHSAEQMVNMSNTIIDELGDKCICKQVIISGGILDYLDGYYLINKLSSSAIYGQASAFLKHARGDYKLLYDYVATQVEGYNLAKAFLKIR